jgi:hypothetical protein
MMTHCTLFALKSVVGMGTLVVGLTGMMECVTAAARAGSIREVAA